jgi:hypothetical protein
MAELGLAVLAIEHCDLVSQSENFHSQFMARSEQGQRVAQHHPENLKHDNLRLITNPRQSTISHRDGVLATHTIPCAASP